MGPTVDDFQNRVAQTAIGGSTLRNQGAKGVVSTAREFLADLALEPFSVGHRGEFEEVLDRETARLQRVLPDGGDNWGDG